MAKKNASGVIGRKSGTDKNPGKPQPSKGKKAAPKGKPNS